MFKPMRTLTQCLVKVKATASEEKRKGAVDEVPCQE